MKTYRVGRDPGSDIVVSQPSVSRDHADLVDNGDGSYAWIDRNSANGSFRYEQGGWVRFTKGGLAADQPLRLGRFETTIAQLLPRPRSAQPIVGPVERDSYGIPRPKK